MKILYIVQLVLKKRYTFFYCVVSEREARSSSGGSAAEPEVAGLSQQGGAASTPLIHVHCSQGSGGETAQRGENFCPSLFCVAPL